MTNTQQTWQITAKTYIRPEEKKLVEALEQKCLSAETIALKLELDYKASCAEAVNYEVTEAMNEFLAWQDHQLIGYIGISSFGGSTMEVNGMVAPEYRRQGVFKALYQKVYQEFQRRGDQEMLLLTDGRSQAGNGFIASLQAEYDHTEFEMVNASASQFLQTMDKPPVDEGFHLRLASNADQAEIVKQNAIYFDCDPSEVPAVLPEEEATRGMFIYIAELKGQIIGKANLQVIGGVNDANHKAGIFSVGVLPEFRGRGYGRSILMGMLDQCHGRNIDHVFLQVEAKNETALTLYLSCGFEVTSSMVYSLVR